jgi:galactokinase
MSDPAASGGAIFSPYRICPIGAHVDHQGGVMLGRTIQLGTTLSYEPSPDRQVWIVSRQLGEARFTIGEAIDHAHWARYAQAAARVLDSQLERGIRAQVSGELIGGGLSSSASVGLAYLTALAQANGLDLSREQLVQLDFQLENAQLGLKNGLLDPLTIVYGRQDALLFMDSRSARADYIPDPPGCNSAWIVAYSGIPRELTKSGFNSRVEQCQQAAQFLLAGATILADVPPELFDERKASLPAPLRRRAEHYFSEVRRVREGARAWEVGDLAQFGDLMNRSCRSSIDNYEVGSPLLIELHEIASNARGVYGSRFSGGGYAGCVVALAQRDRAESAAGEIAECFASRHPELRPRVFVAEMGDGLEIHERP